MEELFYKIKLMFPLELKPREDFKNVACLFNGTVNDDILNSARKIGLNEDIAFFYKKTDGIEAKWNYAPDLEGRTFGHLRILEIATVLGDNWEEFFYSDGADIRLKHFKPIDYCDVSNMYCGLVLDGSGDQAMYCYDFSGVNLLPLDIDFKSYFELAIDAKVMYGWQYYLVHQITPQNITIDFPDKMKAVFPDFDLEAFTAKFESMRLSKR